VKNCWPAKPRLRRPSQRVRRDLCCGAGTRAPRSRRVNSGRRHQRRCRTVRTWTHTRSNTSDPSAHAVEFSKTAAPSREGDSFSDGAPEREPLKAGLVSIAPMRSLLGHRRAPTRTGRGSIAPPPRPASGDAPSPGRRPRPLPATTAQDRTWTETTRSRGRSSKSMSTTCCHVPSPRSPRTTGTDSDGPITAARRCACAFVSWLRALCS